MEPQRSLGTCSASETLEPGNVKTVWKAVWQFFKELNLELPPDSAIPLSGTFPRKMKTCVRAKTVRKKNFFKF